jgi:hypothetical protein
MRFERAFKEARDSGDKTFEFEGKSYNTRIAAESKSAPLPPKRDIPRVDDPEKTYPEEAATPLPPKRDIPRVDDPPKARRSMFERMPNPYEKDKQSEADSSNDVQGPPTAPKKSRTSIFERMPNPYKNAAKGDATEAPAPDLVPDIYKGERQVPDQQYRKGGMVKKKSGGMMKKKSGGSVRGAGIAQRGQGKMRMC